MNYKAIFTVLMVSTLAYLTQNIQAQEQSLDQITSADDTIRKPSFNAYPYAFYTPETKLAFGAGGIFIFYGGKAKTLKPSKTSFGAYYSTNKQYQLSMNNKFYFFDNKLYFNWPMIFSYNVDKFWGVGNTTENTGNESYTKQLFSTSVTIQLPPRWFVSDLTGIIFDYQKVDILDKRTNEYLLNDSVPGSNGAELIGLGSDLMWDTRDNIFFPNSGGYQYFKLLIYPGMSDNVFTFYELDVRHFMSFKEDHVLAGLFYVSGTTGDVPFFSLPALGGKRMRGFFNGRYRDNFLMTLQLEYRQMVWWRLGFAVFGGIGDVSASMIDFNAKNIKYNFGAGLRLMFNEAEKVNLRVDFGMGSGGNSGLYFGIEEAF